MKEGPFMEKTKLGLSTGAVAALAYLMYLFGGYTVGLLFLGYVVLCEKDTWLRKTAVTALLVAACFSCLSVLIGLLPDIVNLVGSLLRVFKVYLYLEELDSLYSFFSNIISLARIIVFALLAVLAFQKKTVQIKALDKLFD
jgi:uncharacterized membrane protein